MSDNPLSISMAESSVPPLPVHLTKRIRSACDRCHGQKLRCRKIPGNGQCARCTKAQVSCVFSPANRGFRSNPVSGRVNEGVENGVGVAEVSSSSEDSQDNNSPPEAGPTRSASASNTEPNHAIQCDNINNSESDLFTQLDLWNPNDPSAFSPDLNDFDFDIENLDFSLAEDLSQTNASLSSSSPETAWVNNIPPSPAIPTTPFFTAGLYIQRLSSLSVTLYDLASTISPPGVTPPPIPGRNHCQPDGCDFEVDKIFIYTQNFLGIMDELFPRLPSTYPFYNAFNNNISDLAEQAKSKHLLLDPATMLLLLSCYLRLVDIFEILLQYTQNLVQEPGPPCMSMIPRKQRVAAVSVGSYNADSAMTASLAILNIFMGLSRQLFDRMRGVASIMAYEDGREAFLSKIGQVEVTQTAFRSAEKRTHEASQKFNQVRMQLFQIGVL